MTSVKGSHIDCIGCEVTMNDELPDLLMGLKLCDCATGFGKGLDW